MTDQTKTADCHCEPVCDCGPTCDCTAAAASCGCGADCKCGSGCACAPAANHDQLAVVALAICGAVAKANLADARSSLKNTGVIP